MTDKENLQRDLLQNPKQPEDKILELVNWIDENEKQVIRPQDIFSNWKGALLFSVGVSFTIVEVLNFITSTNTDKVFTLLTLTVIFLAFVSIIIQTTEQNVIETRLKNALRIRKFTDREKPLLKALIKIKSKNKQFKLRVLYSANKEANGDIFTENKLLEIICIN
ncbi:MAG: hypothetical protein ABSF44_03990 [Candidatus Bathyarchaeia archaeon]|jgi:hypothetical protein